MKNNLRVFLALALLPFASTVAFAQEEQATKTDDTAGTQAEVANEKLNEKTAKNIDKKSVKTEDKAQAVPVSEMKTEEQKELPPQAAPAPQPPKEDPEVAAKKAEQKRIQLLQMKKAKIDAEIGLAKSEQRKKLAAETDARIRLEVATALRNAKISAEFAAIDEEKRMLDANMACDSARDNLAMQERTGKIREAELDSRIARISQELKMNNYNLELTRARLQQTDRALTTKAPEYLKDPLVDGTLYISDRRIEFNGPVTDSLAEFVVDRLNFFNNKSTEYPIFIVIDNSPGGSAFAGYQILKAIDSSKAPVCVVLKTFCASMAAIVTTLAPESYCYESSIILHHQASSSTRGNVRVMTEQLEDMKYWAGRLFAPVCQKIGLTQEEFVNQMYAHVSTGDWSVFGKEAVERKWVNKLVTKMVETGVVRNDPTALGVGGFVFERKDIQQKTDDRGNAYFELPPLKPGDEWLMFDPENRYRSR